MHGSAASVCQSAYLFGVNQDVFVVTGIRSTARSVREIRLQSAWILRCRCKHKHVEHEPVSHTCVKTGCQCVQFNSPWVCNCNHPWDVHTQLILEREVMTKNGLMMAAAADATDTRGVEGGGASSSSYTGSLMSSHSANYAADNKQGGLAARATDYFEVGGSLAPEVNRWDLLRRGGEESN
ncbi:hypothetical protein CEUSTIGMA_g4087.t1 [Chlamydomonas eustigma]|uniref:Protein FAM221A n=1 Tax=Chlamydomonas eustigma TaxID=1157962 RepID=A0A250X0N3_9CHLO|nr:hypothetical protein CEUSTIGMA_g4087.t1 [Chlamydomonas eustigma]|eukprot:GAX76641.1 hypothetical protein CEUSTIGMA_g4087.t1 [Chlamydomonas eustigma]